MREGDTIIVKERERERERESVCNSSLAKR